MPESMPQLMLFNTLTGKEEPFVPLDPAGKKVKMYVCGPTVYDDAHLGHARCYITWDVLYRFLKFLGYDVTYVRNVTDVDDKILNRAQALGVMPTDVAEKNYQSFVDDMRALNVLSPDVEPKATESIPMMIMAIEALIAKNAAYVAKDGSVYFRVSSKPNYLALSKKPPEALQSGARVEVDLDKESPLDFALWKAVPSDEATDEKRVQGYCFESPWGRGRPGWHIECSAMNYQVFQSAQIDIHAGGADLVFPHHENEIAQSEMWHGLHGGAEESHANERFSKYWMHNGFVNVSGEKMSKSLGNFSSVKKVLERYDANTIRYFLLTNNYRMPVDFNNEALQAAENWTRKAETKLKKFKEKLGYDQSTVDALIVKSMDGYQAVQKNWNALFTEKEWHLYFPMGNHFKLKTALLLDLDTPVALSCLNDSLSKVDLQAVIEEDKFHFQELVSIFDLLGFSLEFLFKEETLPKNEIRTIYKEMTGKWLEPDQEPEVLLTEILDMRKRAKEIKNWTQADAIRKHLSDIGIQIMDHKDGTTSWEVMRK